MTSFKETTFTDNVIVAATGLREVAFQLEIRSSTNLQSIRTIYEDGKATEQHGGGTGGEGSMFTLEPGTCDPS